MIKSEDIATLINIAMPELSGRVYPGAAPNGTATPYIVYDVPNETPIITKDGIAGYVTMLEVFVASSSKLGSDDLKKKLIARANYQPIGESKMKFKSSEYSYLTNGDIKLHLNTLTFKI